jgi:hypothetical protein
VRELCRRRWPSSAAIVLLLCCGARCARVSARDRLPGLAAGAGGDARGVAAGAPARRQRGIGWAAGQPLRGMVAAGPRSLQASAAARPGRRRRAALLWFALRQRSFTRLLDARPALPSTSSTAMARRVVGWWRSRIVLPADFRERYTRGERRLVSRTRSRTCARRHPRAGLATALRCLFWFNPLVHYAAAQFRFDQELACDAAVLAVSRAAAAATAAPCSRPSWPASDCRSVATGNPAIHSRRESRC